LKQAADMYCAPVGQRCGEVHLCGSALVPPRRRRRRARAFPCAVSARRAATGAAHVDARGSLRTGTAAERVLCRRGRTAGRTASTPRVRRSKSRATSLDSVGKTGVGLWWASTIDVSLSLDSHGVRRRTAAAEPGRAFAWSRVWKLLYESVGWFSAPLSWRHFYLVARLASMNVDDPPWCVWLDWRYSAACL